MIPGWTICTGHLGVDIDVRFHEIQHIRYVACSTHVIYIICGFLYSHWSFIFWTCMSECPDARRFNRTSWLELLRRLNLAPESTTDSYQDGNNVRRFKGSAGLKKSQVYPPKFGREVPVLVIQKKCKIVLGICKSQLSFWMAHNQTTLSIPVKSPICTSLCSGCSSIWPSCPAAWFGRWPPSWRDRLFIRPLGRRQET